MTEAQATQLIDLVTTLIRVGTLGVGVTLSLIVAVIWRF